MRPSPPRIALNVTRNFTNGSLTGAGPRPWRSFHLTAAASMPRRRSFFTSNPYLSANPEEHPKSPSNGNNEKNTKAAAAAYSQAKRKATRSATAKNSLRRVAMIAQAPKQKKDIGQNEDGDTMNLISATCVAETFKMPMVLDILSSHGFAINPDGTDFDANEVVHARGVNGGDIFVFPSGTIVTWSLPPDVVTRQLLRAAEDPHKKDLRELEDLEFITDINREASTMKGDIVVLGTKKESQDGDTLDTTLAKVAFSSGLARSTKLAVLESALTNYFESTREIPHILGRGAGFPFGRRFILQKTGELLGLRARLNHYSELTDSLPDILWDSRSELGLEGYYELVGRALDVNVRIRTLNQKMDYANEIASVLREMSSEQHGTRLEVIIILLIAVEVIFEVRRIVIEWGQERELARQIKEER